MWAVSRLDSAEIRDVVEKNFDQKYTKDLLVRLMKISSYQTDKLENEPMVLSFIEGLKFELEEIGVTNVVIDEIGNLIMRLGGRNGRRMMYVGYGMTAAPGSMRNPFSGEIVDGSKFNREGRHVWGRGACEQKGALPAMISALRTIIKSGVELQEELIFVVSTAGETGRHNSIMHVVEKEGVKGNICVIGIGTNNECCLANKGRIDVLISVHGKACHSSTPDKGVNAIEGARLVLNHLNGVSFPETHPHLGRATLTVNSIESFPKATHTVQDLCRLMYDRRLLPGDDPDIALSQIQQIINEIKDYKITVEKGALQYPSEVASDSDVAQVVKESFRVMLNREVKPLYMHGAIDAGYLNKVGIETVMFGPGDIALAHTDHDMVSINDVVDAAKVYAYAAIRSST